MTTHSKNKLGRTGVTYEDVARVAVGLTVAGQNPSIRAVRSVLGTGSESTLASHLRAWRGFEASKKQDDLEAGLSKELLAAIHSEITKHTNDTKSTMKESLTQAHSSAKELEEMLKISEKKYEELNFLIEEKDKNLRAAKAELEAEEKAFRRLEAEMNELRQKMQRERDYAVEMKTQNEFMTKINEKLERELKEEREKRLEFEVKIAKIEQLKK